MTHGWALARLLDIHAALRRDLALLREAIAGRADPGDVAGELSVRGRCATFCGFVHEHHATEDALMFPMLLRNAGDAGLAATIAALQADHRVLGRYVDELDRAMTAPDGVPAGEVLQRLADHLEAHLAREETVLAPALDAVSRVVPEDAVPAPRPERLGSAG